MSQPDIEFHPHFKPFLNIHFKTLLKFSYKPNTHKIQMYIEEHDKRHVNGSVDDWSGRISFMVNRAGSCGRLFLRWLRGWLVIALIVKLLTTCVNERMISTEVVILVPIVGHQRTSINSLNTTKIL